MKELICNMLETECDALVITTNGFVKANGQCVMGRGIAKQIADLIPYIPSHLGRLIKIEGNNVHLLSPLTDKLPALISFPVKPKEFTYDGTNAVSHCKANMGERVAGFLAKADIKLIERSLEQLVKLADNNPQWKIILVPRVGCGAGELDYKDIKPLMEKYLDDRFICCSFK